jgi:hypothetical protein
MILLKPRLLLGGTYLQRTAADTAKAAVKAMSTLSYASCALVTEREGQGKHGGG